MPKQTIYRWWPSKDSTFLLDTLIEDASGQLQAIPDAGSAVESARRYLLSLARFLNENPAGKALLALIGEAQHDKAMACRLPRSATSTRGAKPNGKCCGAGSPRVSSADLDVDAALDALLGPVFYRGLTGAPIPQSFIDRLIADALQRHLN